MMKIMQPCKCVNTNATSRIASTNIKNFQFCMTVGAVTLCMFKVYSQKTTKKTTPKKANKRTKKACNNIEASYGRIYKYIYIYI